MKNYTEMIVALQAIGINTEHIEREPFNYRKQKERIGELAIQVQKTTGIKKNLVGDHYNFLLDLIRDPVHTELQCATEYQSVVMYWLIQRLEMHENDSQLAETK